MEDNINSIADFIVKLKQIRKDKRYELFFRGHNDSKYKLEPSIYRNKKLISNEDVLFKEFILRTPADFLNENTALEKLVKMQHYGLPTRLLDITTNPLVALYFACKDKMDVFGEVIVFRIKKEDVKYYDSDTISIIANIAKRPSSFSINKDKKEVEEEIQYLLHEIREEKPYFQDLVKIDDINKTIAVKVKQNNSRIIKQSGAFFIFGINGNKEKPAKIREDWILTENSKREKYNFKIPNYRKEIIIDELNRLGVNESTLFPELDYQAKYLINQYKK